MKNENGCMNIRHIYIADTGRFLEPVGHANSSPYSIRTTDHTPSTNAGSVFIS